jgi:hypothetical protein
LAKFLDDDIGMERKVGPSFMASEPAIATLRAKEVQ